MAKVYLRWEKEGNKLCSRWSKAQPDLTLQENSYICSVSLVNHYETSTKTELAAIMRVQSTKLSC